jgi:type IV pilus assembly protein PilV
MNLSTLQRQRASRPASSQRGVMLLEAMVSVLIFLVGIVALTGMQARAISLSQDAQYRAEAAYLANSLLSQMWVSNKGTLTTDFATGSTLVNAWTTQVNARLPGANVNPPTIIWGANNLVVITIRWKLPSVADVRKLDVSAQVVAG